MSISKALEAMMTDLDKILKMLKNPQASAHNNACEEAIANYSRAIELDPQSADDTGSSSVTLVQMNNKLAPPW